ncbi:MAG: 50S ribosomal protein L35 [Acidobacteria bacterium]|nr:MAG: 50S ribosomal protein L35 [Acidobacteriota bacterium]
MPKLKSHRGAAKRTKTTGGGKIVLNHANKSHILTKKSKKRKRNLRKGFLASAGDTVVLKKMLPYG